MRELIEKATSLPSIPKVLQDLIASFQSDTVSSEQIATILNSDQALTAKVLRLANSAKYGGHRKIGSVKDAVLVLGTSTLRTLVLSVGLAGSFKAIPGFDLPAYWRYSFRMANRAKYLAKLIKADADVAYTCGLLHGVGEYLIHIVKPETAVLIDQEVAAGNRRREIEMKHLGFDFTQAGAELARHWHFPEEIAQAIQHQYTPAKSGTLDPYASLLVLSRYLIEHEQDIQKEQFELFPAKLAHALHLQLDDVYKHILAMPDVDADIEMLMG
ncbi:HDOD domain-containing protein [Rheinheimera sp. UJ51]|uniref:HDOD domain-containing protein n=1 Tax=unclassified Rheinheimera TaxID=115860 RepID=UPI001E5E8BCC|nr:MULTISPECIES: HDOD domain-containing protein [unclassified Rheinheimera]MCC5450773.1 HDOD domain-containing protein [Rheinheimera sp. UJ51]MCF4008552.1 HDOD domain-containing protein [Rheinheimera sp. UJ63]